MLCIECSACHRNLGSHLSKVRSLGLDELQLSQMSVMLAIGNLISNSVYEAKSNTILSQIKPNASSTREEKETWIRRKYEAKEFVTDIDAQSLPIGKLLIEAVVRYVLFIQGII